MSVYRRLLKSLATYAGMLYYFAKLGGLKLRNTSSWTQGIAGLVQVAPKRRVAIEASTGSAFCCISGGQTKSLGPK
eukprot:1714337-Karenia_brevis.AAC.1